jgi:tRNA modification GTPase
VVEVHLDLGGYPVLLADTAGLRAAAEAVEEEGVRRALARAADADLRLLVFDGRTWPELDSRTLALADADALVLLNKSDLADGSARPGRVAGAAALAVSARTGEGLEALVAALGDRAAQRFDGMAGAPLTRARHRHGLEACREALERAFAAPAPELAAEDVRLAVRAIGRITGAVDVEDLLDVIFRDFCIGK